MGLNEFESFIPTAGIRKIGTLPKPVHHQQDGEMKRLGLRVYFHVFAIDFVLGMPLSPVTRGLKKHTIYGSAAACFYRTQKK